MPSFVELLQQSSGHAWLFMPSAILLGALHGLEPGHSKTMMAAFIVAIRGTVMQAVMLGLAATFSHTLVVWAIAIGGMYLWQGVDAEALEPYFQLASAVIIVGVALWMLKRTWDDQRRAMAVMNPAQLQQAHLHDYRQKGGHQHTHGHAHSHDHGAGHYHGHMHQHQGDRHESGELVAPKSYRIETPTRTMFVEITRRDGADHWLIRSQRGQPWNAGEIAITVERPDGKSETFTFAQAQDGLLSIQAVAPPHRYVVHLSRTHEKHSHDYDFSFGDDVPAKAAAAHAGHHHGDVRRIDTGHGTVAVEVFEDGVPPRWRLRVEKGQRWAAKDVTIVTERPDGTRQAFSFADRGGYLESNEEIPEAHEFMARVSLGHGGHTHDYDLSFIEGEGRDHMHEELRGLQVATDDYQDAHELAHANDIRRQFADRNVTNWQIILFGLTGGLIPCPAAITVLLLCLQLKEISLGFVLVLCFSIGLAVTLVAVGSAAALSARHASKRWSGFSVIARRAPYLSSILIIAVGLYVGYHGWAGLAAQAGTAVGSGLLPALGG